MSEPATIIANGEKLYRRIRRKDFFWNPAKCCCEIGYSAFIRRSAPKDSDGLSVDRAAFISAQDCIMNYLGLAALTAGDVRKADSCLDVVPKPNLPGANITGLPQEPSDNSSKCEEFAEKLRLCASWEIPPNANEQEKSRKKVTGEA